MGTFWCGARRWAVHGDRLDTPMLHVFALCSGGERLLALLKLSGPPSPGYTMTGVLVLLTLAAVCEGGCHSSPCIDASRYPESLPF